MNDTFFSNNIKKVDQGRFNSFFDSIFTAICRQGEKYKIGSRSKGVITVILHQRTGFVLAGLGMLVSGYSVFRLSSDSHLVCAPDGQSGNYSVAQADKVQKQGHESSTSETQEIDLEELSSQSAGEDSVPNPENVQTKLSQENTVVIDLSGAVKKPGLYKVPQDSRIGDVLSIAGGISVQASAVEVAQAINLASKVKDGQKIYIPFIGEDLSEILTKELSFGSLESKKVSGDGTSSREGETSKASGQSAQGSNSALGSSAGSTDASATSNSDTNGVVSINSASSTQLMELKGIGEKRAADIIAGRPYEKVEELLTKGIITQGVYADILSQLKL